MLFHDEPPKTVLVRLAGVADADSFGGGDFWGEAVVADPEGAVFCGAGSVLDAGDAESFGQLAWAGGFCAGPDEDRFRVALLPGDEVQHPVDAVAEVDVDGSGFLVQDFGPRGAAPAGVTGGVLLAAVGFRFGDPQLLAAEDQHFAYQVPGDLRAGPVVEVVGQFAHSFAPFEESIA